MLLLDEVDHPSFSNLLIFVVLVNSHFKTTAAVNLTTPTNRSCSGATAATAAAYEKNTYVPRSSKCAVPPPHARSSIRCIQRPREKESRQARGERDAWMEQDRVSQQGCCSAKKTNGPWQIGQHVCRQHGILFGDMTRIEFC